MKHVIKNAFKQFTMVVLIYSISTAHSLYSMHTIAAFNNAVTIKNKNNSPQSLLQLQYDQTELCPHAKRYSIVGINTVLSTPTKIKCFITNEDDPNSLSLLTLLDPKSKQRKLLLTAYNNESFTIHHFNKRNKTIVVTKNKQEVGRFTYQ